MLYDSITACSGITILPIFVPALLIYGVRSGGPLFYWIGGSLLFLLLPVLPLTIASAGVLFLMRLTNLSRKKDILQFIGLIAMIVFTIGFNYLLGSIPAGGEQEFIQRILVEKEGLVNYFGSLFPPALLMTRALTLGGYAALKNYLLLFTVSCLGFLTILLLGVIFV